MAIPYATSQADPGGAAASFSGAFINYYSGSPGTVSFAPGGGCPEQRAIEAGGAVTLVVADMACQKVQGIRIIIGDTAESIHSGFEMVNMNFHTSGTQMSIASNFNLSGPVVA